MIAGLPGRVRLTRLHGVQMFDLQMCLLLAADEKAVPPGAWLLQLVPFLFVGYLAYILLIRPDRRKQQQTLGSLKKNDRVVTVGGLIGTVVEIPAEGDDLITLKVDDNTRIKFRKSAVQGPYTPPAEKKK